MIIIHPQWGGSDVLLTMKKTAFGSYYDNQINFLCNKMNMAYFSTATRKKEPISRNAHIVILNNWCVCWHVRLLCLSFGSFLLNCVVLSHRHLFSNSPSLAWQHVTPPLGCLSPDPGRPEAQIPVCYSNTMQPIEDSGQGCENELSFSRNVAVWYYVGWQQHLSGT